MRTISTLLYSPSIGEVCLGPATMDLAVIYFLVASVSAWRLLLTAPAPNRITQLSRDYLLSFNNHVNCGPPADLAFPDLKEFAIGIGKSDFRAPLHKRGRRGGVRERMRRQHLSHIPLPSMILSNAETRQTNFKLLFATIMSSKKLVFWLLQRLGWGRGTLTVIWLWTGSGSRSAPTERLS